ncbi:MAG: radical SAM protein [Acidobacteria bacterium]|nr:radical SAM protein [Acidobacteriota bacterium]
MNLFERIARHARLTSQSLLGAPSPPFLILFINSICNQKCDHCFYWRNLNRRDDLSFEELVALSESLGRIENLNLSGGEPFLRKEFGAVCRQFIRRNKVRQIYCPTNGYFTDKVAAQVQETLKEPGLELFVAEISLDGLGEFHDRFRHSPHAFEKAMQTYDALAEIQRRDPRLRIHAISTGTAVNMDEIRRLTTYLFDRCPQMDHHNLVLIRGDRKNPSLEGPQLEEFRELYGYMQRLWKSREEGRYGALAEPVTQWTKTRTAQEKRQVAPCRAGNLSAVVYSNGDVSVCENHPPIGNLREASFPAIWRSAPARERRQSIARKQCWCTNETFLWPSVIYHPWMLARSLVGARVWRPVEGLRPAEKTNVSLAPDARSEASLERLVQIQAPGESGVRG